MVPKFNKIHHKFKLNGYHYDFETLKDVAYSFIKEGQPYEKSIGDFLQQWLDANTFITTKTSGSTGRPKVIQLAKQAMVNSAIATGNYFKLQPRDTALHCLPSHYIAGKMMLVRALILGLEIDCVLPNTEPKFNSNKHYSFCAMVPLQVKQTVSKLSNIKTLIIGGSSISKSILTEIKTCKTNCFETYGMTETVTHVAVKQLQTKYSKADSVFKALPNVKFTTDNRQCLVIHAPQIVKDALVTNDSVSLQSSTAFKWLGRFDNVINSGGVKLFPEQIEEKLQTIIKDRIIVAGEKDEILGEKLILIIENPKEDLKVLKESIKTLKNLTKYEVPKAVYTIPKFIETPNGKLQRQKTITSVLE